MPSGSERGRSPKLHGYVVDALEVRIDATGCSLRFGLDRERGDALTELVGQLAMDDHEVTPSRQLTLARGACSHFDRRLQRRVSFQGQFGDSPNRGPVYLAERNLTDRRCHRMQNLAGAFRGSDDLSLRVRGLRAGAGCGARKLLWTQPERYVERLAM
jgi:hypothetical protein